MTDRLYYTDAYLHEFEAQVTACAPSAGGFAVTPVSYTHLRAHETVLDLVCRLLLETTR